MSLMLVSFVNKFCVDEPVCIDMRLGVVHDSASSPGGEDADM